MKKSNILVLFLAGILSLTSCLKDDTDPTPLSIVSIGNVLLSESGVYYQDGGKTITNSNGAYKGMTLFYSIAGNKNFKVFERTSNKTLIDTNLNFVDTLNYVSFVYGTTEKAHFIRGINKGLENLGSKSGVRYFHIANGVEKSNLFIGEQTINEFLNKVVETNETMKVSQKFIAANPGTVTIVAKDKDGNTIATKDNVNLREGYYHDILLIGEKGNTKFPLEIVYSTYE